MAEHMETTAKVTVAKGSKKTPWVVIVVIVVLAAAAGVGLRVWQQRHKPPTPQEVAVSAQDTALLGNSQQAHQELDKALARSNLTADQKYLLLYQQGVTYENEHKYDQAIAMYKQAEAVQPTQSIAEAMGRVAQAKGDNALAISYYKKALARIPASRPIAAADKDHYQQLIIQLGGQL